MEGPPARTRWPQTASDGRAPTSYEDMRALRRWVLVAGVWAVAATAVALIALVDTSTEDAEQTAAQATDNASRLAARQRRLGRRLARVESRLEGLAPAGEVTDLADRLGRAEAAASAARNRAGAAAQRLSRLEERVRSLGEGATPVPGDTGAPPGPPDQP